MNKEINHRWQGEWPEYTCCHCGSKAFEYDDICYPTPFCPYCGYPLLPPNDEFYNGVYPSFKPYD